MSPSDEHPGAAYELGEQLTIVGKRLEVGAQSPEFTLETLDAASGGLRLVRLADTAGSVRLLNIVNSLDTPVCDVETRHWERLRTGLTAGVVLYTVSMDLPWAMARWSAAEGVEHQ